MDTVLNKPFTQQSNNTLPIKINKLKSFLLWLLFLGNVVYLAWYFPNIPNVSFGNLFVVNSFTILIWTAVTFFSAIVSSYSRNYLNGFKYHTRFSAFSFLFTISVMLLVASNNIIPLVLSWLIMGYAMANLIGINKDWGEAKEAAKYAFKFFLAGSILLGTALSILAYQVGSLTISEIIEGLSQVPTFINIIAALMIITAAVIQSAIYPFHRWLLSAMTAPTPASALMHAGFVNGSGILLALFASLLLSANTMEILFIIGGITAIVAQFTKLLQVTVKQKLACSTIAQMGFMIMQCGLGFFNAAIAHLILHGFYKAYLFLSSGEEIEMSKPKKDPKIKISFIQAVVVLIYGVLGAYLFIELTGKGNTVDSSIFLTLIVAITVGQMTYNIVKTKTLSILERIIIPIALFFGGIAVYALMFNGISLLMTNANMVSAAIPLNAFHVVFGAIFLIGFFLMKLGVYKKIPWLYVKLLNASQPYKKTVLTYKKEY